jgi:hypothetical protein
MTVNPDARAMSMMFISITHFVFPACKTVNTRWLFPASTDAGEGRALCGGRVHQEPPLQGAMQDARPVECREWEFRLGNKADAAAV